MPLFKLEPNPTHEGFPNAKEKDRRFIVKAPDEETARLTAGAFLDGALGQDFWLDPARSTCKQLVPYPAIEEESPPKVLRVDRESGFSAYIAPKLEGFKPVSGPCVNDGP